MRSVSGHVSPRLRRSWPSCHQSRGNCDPANRTWRPSRFTRQLAAVYAAGHRQRVCRGYGRPGAQRGPPDCRAGLWAGCLGDRMGRKRLLVAGWLVGLPVPLLIILAPSWGWVVLANVLLGVNQGLCWSTTVIMKIDLVGPKQRGLAMGLNEFAGYLAVSLSALITGYLAAVYGLRPTPFYPGIAFAVLGLVASIFLVKETRWHAQQEATRSAP